MAPGVWTMQVNKKMAIEDVKFHFYKDVMRVHVPRWGRLNPALRKVILKDKHIHAYAQAEGGGCRRQGQPLWFYFQRRKGVNPLRGMWLEGKKRPPEPPAPSPGPPAPRTASRPARHVSPSLGPDPLAPPACLPATPAPARMARQLAHPLAR